MPSKNSTSSALTIRDIASTFTASHFEVRGSTDAILEVSAYRARLIKTKHREEQQDKRLVRKRVFAVWRKVTHWIAGHKRPTHFALSSFGVFHFSIYNINEGTDVDLRFWK